MKNNAAQYLKSLINQKKYKINIDFLDSLLNSESINSAGNCHDRFLVKFAKSRSKMRFSSVNGQKEVHGLHELSINLTEIDEHEYIDAFNLSNGEFLGTCFVYKDNIIGIEFVRRGGAYSFKGLIDI